MLSRCCVAVLLLVAPKVMATEFAAWPQNDDNSQTAHRQLLEKAGKGRIDVYFLGDSITRRWGCTDPAYKDLMENWRKNFYGWNAANFGWGGDTTHNVLWRIQNGELDGVDPKVIVLQVGTNDIGWRSYNMDEAKAKVAEVTQGVKAIISECLKKAPNATILLTGIFPRGDNPKVAPMIKDINDQLAQLAPDERVRFLNINDGLTDDEGSLREGMTVDGLHLSARGYDVWAAALKPHFSELLGPPAKKDLAPPPTGNPAVAN